MDAETFVANWADQKEQLLKAFCDAGSDTYVRTLISELKLDSEQQPLIRQVIDAVLTGTMYGLLLGLEGEASIGNDQRPYQIVDENDGQVIAGPGEIEAAAYECFHGEESLLRSAGPGR